MLDNMIQNINDQAEKDQNSSLGTYSFGAKQRAAMLNKRCKGSEQPNIPNPSSNKHKKNMTRQTISKTYYCVLLWCQTKRGNALSTRGKGSAVMIMQIASHRIH